VALYVVPPARIISPRPSEVPAPSSPIPATPDKPSSPPPETPQSTLTPPPSSELTTKLFKVTALPSLDARVTALRFFTGSCRGAPRPQARKYTRRFPTDAWRFPCAIFTEITLEYPTPERCIYFTLKAIYQSEDTGVIDRLLCG
jgi:hypothetical protein